MYKTLKAVYWCSPFYKRKCRYILFYYTICVTHFTGQMIQFVVSYCCKHNSHITALETNDLI